MAQHDEDTVNIQLLIQGCLRQNPLSQRKLYEHFYGYAMSIGLRYARHKDEALEIVNDAFLKAFRNLSRYDPEQAFKPWLRRIVVNAAIDYYRQRQNNFLFADWEEAPDQQLIDQDSLPSVGESDDVLPIIQQLPPAYRMVFNLYVMEEYKHHEIAEMLGISVGTSKSNLTRAKEKLRELWLTQKGLSSQRI